MRNNVRIILGPDAYELLEKNCLSSDCESVKMMIEKPSIKETGCKYPIWVNDDYEDMYDAVYIGWDDIKWSDRFEDVNTVINTLKECDDIVENDPSKDRYYFYKFMRIREDGYSEEYTNDDDDIDRYVEDYYVVHGFSK